MNKLNKKIISFVLLFSICLLVNVSYAEFSSTPINTNATYTSSNTSSTIAGYTLKQIKNFFTSTDDSAKTAMLNTLNAEDYKVIWAPTNADASQWHTFIFPSSFDVGAYVDSSSKFRFILSVEPNTSMYYVGISSSASPKELSFSTSGYYNTYGTMSVNFTLDTFNSMISKNAFGNVSYIKKLTYISGGYTWDGTSYYYEVPSVEPEQPTMPTNAEITQAVQAFYNSDYYKNNKDFKDFIVMYNYNNQYFSFIGHNNEDKFQQLIFPAGYKYDKQWWKFGLDGLIDTSSSYLFNKRYWLYSSNDFGETIAYNGEGYMKDLLELNFSTSSIIVYSSNNYDVIYYTYNENNELTSEMETMPGDQYTYDENLDPTTNEYNPLENFVPTNPSQTILGDVDFDEINKIFEENKDILNIEGASWLFTANNKLVGYFIGFLSLLIVFLIISRILGG